VDFRIRTGLKRRSADRPATTRLLEMHRVALAPPCFEPLDAEPESIHRQALVLVRSVDQGRLAGGLVERRRAWRVRTS
jgi:hypothetical protein